MARAKTPPRKRPEPPKPTTIVPPLLEGEAPLSPEERIITGPLIREQITNTGILTSEGWRPTWVSITQPGRINLARRMHIDIPQWGDERVLNQEAFLKVTLGGADYIGRTDTIVGLMSDRQYRQYLRDLHQMGQDAIEPDGGETLRAEKISRDALAREAAERAAMEP